MTFAPAARILIIDDNPDVIRLLGSLLQDLGEVRFATSGELGIQLAHSERPHLILLDIEMGGLGGFEVCARLKSDPETAESAIIFVTGHRDEATELRAFEAGAVDFIPKPIQPQVARARAKAHLTLKRQEEALLRLSLQDPLTGLFNRRHFEAHLKSEWQRALRAGTPLVVAMADVDFFKRFNDHFGHPEGDACLKAVAETLRAFGRRPGDVIARYGGEEFVMLLPGLGAEAAEPFAQSICEAVRSLGIPHPQSSVAEVVTLSLGLSLTLPSAKGKPQDLLRSADERLYEAKTDGRARAKAGIYDPDSAP